MNKHKICEIYHITPLEDKRTCLTKAWNQAIQKTPEELNAKEICMFLRQNDFLDTIIPLAVQKIKENPLYGDLFDGEALTNLSEIKSKDEKTVQFIQELIEDGEVFASNHTWEDPIDKEEYLNELKLAKVNLSSAK